MLLNETLPVREDIEHSQPPHPSQRTRLCYDKMQHLIDRAFPGVSANTQRAWEGTETDGATLQHWFASAQEQGSLFLIPPPGNMSEGRSHELAAHPITHIGLKAKGCAEVEPQTKGCG